MGASCPTHRYNSGHPASRSIWERLNVLWYGPQLLYDRTTGLWLLCHMPCSANGTVVPRVPLNPCGTTLSNQNQTPQLMSTTAAVNGRQCEFCLR